MRLLFIGDIVGKPGRGAVNSLLPNLKKELELDFLIANGENLSRGKGMNTKHAEEMFAAGIDFFTTGNHIWKQADIFAMMNRGDTRVIRPANYPNDNPGRGYQIVETDMMKKILIINLQGRVFMKEDVDCPFKAFDRVLEETAHEKPDIIFVDFHAEATSEKICFGHYVDGRADVVVGTHTHVPTADNRILPKGTAYISDVGCVGLTNSAIGVDLEPIIHNFLTQMPVKHTLTEGGPVTFNSVMISLEASGPMAIERVQREYTP